MIQPLTKMQYLLWAGQKMSPESPLYNMPFRFDIKGEVDVELFIISWKELVEEVDTLRTIIVLDDESLPKQKVIAHDGQIEFLDWSITPKTPGEIDDWIEERNGVSFDLSHPPYLCFLIKLSNTHYVWYINQHHIILDAWGASIMCSRLSEIYSSKLAGKEKGDQLPLFGDYVQFEQRCRTSAAHEKKQIYWNKVVSDLPPLSNLYNFSEGRHHTRTTRVSLDLTHAEIEKLNALINEPDVVSFTKHISLLSVFLSVLFAYMYRVSGQNRLSIGTPAHNRSTLNFKKTCGPFIEFFPIVSEVQSNDSFGTLYQRVRSNVMSFLMNSDSALASPELSSSFNVVLNYIHASFPNFNGLPTTSEWLPVGHCDPRHDIRMHVLDYEDNGNIQVLLDLNQRVMPEPQADRAKHQLKSLLQAFIHDRSALIEQIPIVNNDEYGLLSSTCRGPKVSVDQHIVRRLDHFIQVGNKNVGLVSGDSNYSYEEIDRAVKHRAHWLMTNGVTPGQRIGILLKRTPELVFSLLATMRCGATFVLIPYGYPNARINHIIQDAQVDALITSSLLETEFKVDKKLFVEDIPDTIEEHQTPHYSTDHPAYILYTSGSTGKPKGVVLNHTSLENYIDFATKKYAHSEKTVMPLFTSVGFDLTITSLFLPLCLGGILHIFEEPDEGPDLSVMDVFKSDVINTIKLTPSHLEMIKDHVIPANFKTFILGGEDLKCNLAKAITEKCTGDISIYNEYGPTEATVGCIVHEFDIEKDQFGSVPIGKPIQNAYLKVVNHQLQEQPINVSGELLIGGIVLAEAYWNDESQTGEKFIRLSESGESRYYRTGDKVYVDDQGLLYFQGRLDQQLKLNGRRIEPGEIEETALQVPEIQQAVVTVVSRNANQDDVVNCISCGLPSNFPGVSFDETNECSLCTNYQSYANRVKGYFRELDELKEIFNNSHKSPDAQYDCIMLLSGGKDSTYALAQLADLGLKVLAFTLDNGYISQGALDNAQRVCRALGVDHMFGKTEAMNAIFVDSLQRHNNVCNGCFKTIYTLSLKVALDKNIPFIVTGLSRGQFFETRLTEELFWDDSIQSGDIDDIILKARKAYHQVDDAVNQLLDVSFLEDETIFDKVKFLDFYRYCDVELGDLMKYLDQKLPWVRPKDTGRSTNCLINQVGIHIHKKNVGYSNYAFPYSWDVRIGHKNREESLDEINEVIDVQAVNKIIDEIGYQSNSPTPDSHLTLFYTSESLIPTDVIQSHMQLSLPDYMIPWSYVRMDGFPLTHNGKVDLSKLIASYRPERKASKKFEAPETDIEIMLAAIWQEVLLEDEISRHDAFLELGGNSLIAIRLISRVNKKFRLDLSLNAVFKYPTVATFAQHIEATILELMKQHN